MIDVTKILKRAWNILWSYRTLWLLGLLLALTTASAYNRGSSSLWRENVDGWQSSENIPFPTGEEIRDAWEQVRVEINREITWSRISPADWNTFLWVIIGLAILLMLLGIVMLIIRYVVETATIRMVDEYERTGQKVGLRKGLRYGWSRSAWRLFLINLLVLLPVVLLVLGGMVIGVVIFFIIFADGNLLGTAGIITLIGTVFLMIFLAVILGVILTLLRDFFWRVCILEGTGVRQSIRLGWEMVKQNWKSVGLTWLVMIAVRIAWNIALALAFIISLPLLVVTILAGVIVGGIPGLLAGLLSSLFLGGPLPWIIGALFGLPFFLAVAFSPLLLFRGLGLVYNSTVWTLTYREVKAMQNLSPANMLPDEPAEENA